VQPKNLLYLLGALMFILWTSQPVQSQSPPEIPMKKKTCEDLWPVEHDKKCGYIDKTGRLIIPFQFDSAGDFSEGLAAVGIKEKTGYIDKTGKFVIPPRFTEGFRFSEGLAVVLIRLVGREGITSFYKYGYIDKSGKVVIQPPQDPESLKWFSYAHKGLSFSEGLAYMAHGKLGYIDKAGKPIIPPKYNDVQPFSEGLAAVKLEDKYGYIDRSGEMVIPPRFEDAGPFSEGLAPARNGNQWVYIDKSGKLVITGGEFVLARAFSEGLAAVIGKNDKYGYIDKTGKFVIQPQFTRAGDFSEGLAPVMPIGAIWPGNLAYINQKGQIVIKSMSTVPDRPERVELDLSYYHFCGGVARVSQGKNEDRDAEGYINKEGKFIWPEVSPSKQELR
jgi:WG containing repeat